MAIYQLFPSNDERQKKEGMIFTPRSFSFSSSLMSRLFCIFLLSASIVWVSYAILTLLIFFFLNMATAFFLPYLKKGIARRFLNLRRSAICTFCLVLALFSPSFGMMVGCSYFLMHDKEGIDQVIPHSLRSHFKQF